MKTAQMSVEVISIYCPVCKEPIANPEGSTLWEPRDVRQVIDRERGVVRCYVCDNRLLKLSRKITLWAKE